MKTLFTFISFALFFDIFLQAPAFAQNGPLLQIPVLCSVRVWGMGKVQMNLVNQQTVLENPNMSEVPDDSFSGQIITPVGPVSVLLTEEQISVHFTQNAISMYSPGRDSASLTVFLGPSLGDNNGLSIACARIQGEKAKTVEPANE